MITTGSSIVRYRNPDMFQKINRMLYISLHGISFLIALILAFIGAIILYGL